MADSEIIIKEDSWLADILGCPSAQVIFSASDYPRSFSKESKNQISRSGFFYTKLDVKKVEVIAQFTELGYRLIDTNVQFRKLKDDSIQLKSTHSRFATDKDCEAVTLVAGSAFRYSRFHLDPLIKRDIADKIKREWALNYFHGKRGTHMVVAEINGTVVGFLQIIKIQESKQLVIDLIAVMDGYQGKGYARDMIAFAQNNIGEHLELLVGTQLANAGSIQLYEKLGFRFFSASYVLHRGPVV